MNVYMSGMIDECSEEEARGWRRLLTEWALHCSDMTNMIDPMRRDYSGLHYMQYREVIDTNKMDIAKCDAVVVRYLRPSVGTAMEVYYAWTLGKPIVVWTDKDIIVPPWMIYHSSRVVEDIEGVIAFIQRVRQ